jgi:predicted RNase H-like HicB family nuclease
MKTKSITRSFVAVFEPNELGGYNVSFPKLPGCHTQGDSFDHAKAMAQEVLELWLEEIDGKNLGQPTIDQITVILKN